MLRTTIVALFLVFATLPLTAADSFEKTQRSSGQTPTLSRISFKGETAEEGQLVEQVANEPVWSLFVERGSLMLATDSHFGSMEVTKGDPGVATSRIKGTMNLQFGGGISSGSLAEYGNVGSVNAISLAQEIRLQFVSIPDVEKRSIRIAIGWRLIEKGAIVESGLEIVPVRLAEKTVVAFRSARGTQPIAEARIEVSDIQ